MKTVELSTKTIPIVEVFGPVVQGEGRLAGAPTHFVRVGLCDFRCSWCDSMYAVEPTLVKEHAKKLTQAETFELVSGLQVGPRWVTLSGGNPAMHDLGDLTWMLKNAGYLVCVETQGSIWKDWLGSVDCLTVSPKPPSSGMVTERHTTALYEFMAEATSRGLYEEGCVKIVAFDEEDVEWAASMFTLFHKWDAYLSVGTDPIREWGKEWEKRVNTRQVRDTVGDRYAWLCEQVVGRPSMSRVKVLPQLHVIAFGHARGV